MNYQNVMIAVDFNDSALKTLDKVKNLGLRDGTKIQLVHAFELFPASFDFMASYMPGPEQKQEIEAAIQERLKKLIERWELGRFQVSTKVLICASARQEFLDYSIKEKAQLIVLASQEKPFLQGVMEGSFGSFMNKYARADLWILRP